MPSRRHVLLGLGAFPFASLSLSTSLLSALLAGCGEDRPPAAALRPVPITAADECAVCGMQIRGFPGPKGEAHVSGREAALKFCSTRDFFAWVLQPEAGASVQALWVHDLGATGWEQPDDAAFTDARSAFYVIGHRRLGAMGPTLASFRERPAAEAFAAREGGRVLAFLDVTVALVAGGLEPG